MDPRAVCLGMLLLAPGITADDESRSIPAASLPEPGGDSMEGIRLGDTFAGVEARLDLRDIEPMDAGDGAKRYRWPAPLDLTSPQVVGNAQQVKALDIVFRGDRVVEISSSYRSSARYTRMGPDLIARYGEPDSVRAGPPTRLAATPRPGGAAREATTDETAGQTARRPDPVQYLWVEIWTWHWEKTALEVTAEHYTRTPDRVEDGVHLFRFRLRSADSRQADTD